jgi:diguanylate cyclase (GGDEF)-like protein/PAS domain S-box-containing protein
MKVINWILLIMVLIIMILLMMEDVVRGNTLYSINHLLYLLDYHCWPLYAGVASVLSWNIFQMNTTWKRLIESEEQYNETTNSAIVGIYIIQNEKFVFVNRTLSELFGYAQSEMIGMNPVSLVIPEKRALITTRLKERSRGIVFEPYDVECIRRSGETFIANVWGQPSSYHGQPASVGTLLDVTKRVENEKKIWNLAYYDSLTTLPNRLYFNDLSEDLINVAIKKNRKFSVFLIDIDEFKIINDTYGHHCGDIALKEVATRLTTSLNIACPMDDNDCTGFSARLGGDEFVLIVSYVEHEDDIIRIIDSIYDQFKTPIIIGNDTIFIDVSIGVARFPTDGSTISMLLKSADLALYESKAIGGHTYIIHNKSMDVSFSQRILVDGLLQKFIETNDFDMAFQPIIHTQSEKICGVESLFRGNEESRQLVTTSEIMKIAEENGAIIPLGTLILHRAIQQCVSCSANLDVSIRMSVNLSMAQLNQPNIVEVVKNAIDMYHMCPENLALEITETVFMQHFEQNVIKLVQLRDMGIHIFLDDFGKGYSSMHYLLELPIDKIKIDMSFIQNITKDKKSKEIVKAIIMLTKALNITSCAEGVETQEQRDILAELECDQIQGYFYSKPLYPTDMYKYVSEQDMGTCKA